MKSHWRKSGKREAVKLKPPVDYGAIVLSRHAGECIMIGDNIAVSVAEIRGDKVRIMVQAPKEVPVDRLEVYFAKKNDPRPGETSS